MYVCKMGPVGGYLQVSITVEGKNAAMAAACMCHAPFLTCLCARLFAFHGGPFARASHYSSLILLINKIKIHIHLCVYTNDTCSTTPLSFMYNPT